MNPVGDGLPDVPGPIMTILITWGVEDAAPYNKTPFA